MSKKNIVKTEEQRKNLEKRNNLLAGITITAVYGIFVLGPGFNFIKNKLEEFNSKNRINRIYSSVSNNDNINNEEKNYLNNIKTFLTDYEKYVDVKVACERLENLDIIYKESKEDGPIITKGAWSGNNDKITYYITSNDSKKERKSVINHELLHLISTHDTYFPQVLTEGITSTICYEYNFSEDSYFNNRLITYMLCEVISSDVVIESYLKGDYSIIEKKLYEIIPDNKTIEKFRENLANYYEYDHLVSRYLEKDLDEYDETIYKGYSEIRDESLYEIADTLCGYYTKKTDKLVGDSKVVEEMFKLNNMNGDYDLKMSIYNAELRKDNYSRFYNYDKKIAIYSITNSFDATTAYFNKRNKKDVSFYEDCEWAFVIDKDTNSLVSKQDEYNKEGKTLIKK